MSVTLSILESSKTIEWFGKPRTNSNQPIFAKLLSGKFTGHFFARWDNKQTEFYILGKVKTLHMRMIFQLKPKMVKTLYA